MESVLTLLRNTCQLEVLHLMGFARFSRVTATVEPIELGKLKSIKFTDCDLPELLPQLRFPQLREFSFCGSNFTPDENTPPSTTSNTDFFSLLQACPLPILDQQALTHITVSTDDKGNKIRFTLRLVSKSPGPMCQFVIATVWEKWASWEERLEWLIRGAIKRIRFSSSVCLYLLHCVNHAQELYSPLLRLPQISVLCTSGWFTPATFKLLMDPSDPTCPPPLPRLKCFCFRGDDLCAPAEEIQSSVELCL